MFIVVNHLNLKLYVTLNHNGVKVGKKSQAMCGQSLNFFFWKFEKSPWEHYISKKSFIFEINSYTFKVATTIFFWNSLCFKSLFICLKHSRKACGLVVFLIKSFFPLSNVHQIISIFLWTLIYSTRRDPCIQNIWKIKIHIVLKILILKCPFTLL